MPKAWPAARWSLKKRSAMKEPHAVYHNTGSLRAARRGKAMCIYPCERPRRERQNWLCDVVLRSGNSFMLGHAEGGSEWHGKILHLSRPARAL